VLLAEDNIDNQRLVSHYLRRLGLDVCIVDNGQLAVERALEEEFSLVLMDMQMPKMDGPEAARILRQTGSSVPIIALTANVGQEDRDRCMSAGCNDFLCKPIDKQHFYTVVSRFLKKAGEVEDVMDDDEEFEELRKKYIALISERQSEVCNAYAGNDRVFIKSSMHQFKGSAGGYGFPDLGRIAAKIEALLKADIDSEIDEEMGCFINECQRIVG
jgi:CheY-like chemotaxis protein